MRLTPEQARTRFAAAPVARLATVRDGRPRIVPIVFAVAGDTVWTAVDHKPKSTTALHRLADIATAPDVCVLADHYADDWTALWWARADGTAHVHETASAGLAALMAKYPHYADRPPAGQVIEIAVTRWSGWAASG